jgi:hypothetical protein
VGEVQQSHVQRTSLVFIALAENELESVDLAGLVLLLLLLGQLVSLVSKRRLVRFQRVLHIQSTSTGGFRGGPSLRAFFAVVVGLLASSGDDLVLRLSTLGPCILIGDRLGSRRGLFDLVLLLGLRDFLLILVFGLVDHVDLLVGLRSISLECNVLGCLLFILVSVCVLIFLLGLGSALDLVDLLDEGSLGVFLFLLLFWILALGPLLLVLVFLFLVLLLLFFLPSLVLLLQSLQLPHLQLVLQIHNLEA